MKTYEKPKLDETNPMATLENEDGSVDIVTIVYFDVVSKTYTVWNEIVGMLMRKVDPRKIEILNDASFTRIPYIGAVV